MICNLPKIKELDAKTKGVQGSQREHDTIHGTSLVMRAIRIEEHPIEFADLLYLAALYNIAAGEKNIAEGQIATIANRFPKYEPDELFLDRTRISYITPEIVLFKREHEHFNFALARQMLEEEKSRYRKGLVRHCLPV